MSTLNEWFLMLLENICMKINQTKYTITLHFQLIEVIEWIKTVQSIPQNMSKHTVIKEDVFNSVFAHWCYKLELLAGTSTDQHCESPLNQTINKQWTVDYGNTRQHPPPKWSKLSQYFGFGFKNKWILNYNIIRYLRTIQT